VRSSGLETPKMLAARQPPTEMWSTGCRRNLRRLIRPNFGAAATLLFHIPGLSVHCPAACTLFATPITLAVQGQLR
jgi:hypothetical protein